MEKGKWKKIIDIDGEFTGSIGQKKTSDNTYEVTITDKTIYDNLTLNSSFRIEGVEYKITSLYKKKDCYKLTAYLEAT